jgi:putative SOS response-associated peptidase YedK
MCGRFKQAQTILELHYRLQQEVRDLFIDFDIETELKQEDIRPTDPIVAMRYAKDKKYSLNLMRWGLTQKINKPIINTKIETIQSSDYWKNLFTFNKCLVPMSGFYEWKNEGRKKKTPYTIYLPGHDLFFAAGIFTRDNDGKNAGLRASILTTEPNHFMTQIHDRMPVLFTIKQGIEYLHNDAETNYDICKPYGDKMEMKLAEELIPKQESLDLFG